MNWFDNPAGSASQKKEGDGRDHSIPENAFLIIRGTKSVPLSQDIIKIGRHHDNTIVIDDPRISRHHAELRAIKGHFDIFDLNSTGGTYVNGMRTAQAILYHGDHISLAGVELLFTQNALLPSRSLKDTSALIPGSGDRGTAFFRTSFFNRKRK
ncbi:MAG TPA: FHA domain-containing protein [Anaerolineales bacterium]|nr:FHA domain-containing protein [Anaerolineales bacterium]